MRRIVPQVQRAVIGIVGFIALMLAVCGCTAAHAKVSTQTVDVTTTETVPRPAPTTSAGPVDVGPTTTSTAACPILSATTAAADVGVRLGRITTLLAGGMPVGCSFYADQDPAFKASEHLPGPNQAVLQIVSTRYTDPITAHNAFVQIAVAGQNETPDNLSATVEGAAFQTTFDPTDGNKDWAFVFHTANTVVVVTTAQTDTSFDAREVAAAIVAKF
jgi:hypothetical protein